MVTIEHKIGDSLMLKFTIRQEDGTVLNLSGFSFNIDCINKSNKIELFKIESSKPTSDRYIDISNIENGELSLIVKDTNLFLKGDYYIDIERIDNEGFVESSRSILLKIVERYL